MYETIESLTYENPVFLSIIDDSGGCLFSKAFDEEIKWNDQLLGFFLSAINKFCHNLFNGTIDCITIGPYLLLFKPQGTFFCCYIFKGKENVAHTRFNSFVETITRSSGIHKELSSFNKNGSLLSHRMQITLDLLASEIFCYQSK
ncbi:MAG: hypothetical protein ACFFBQ_16420 [Promethearchaeota archaeon]